MIAPLQPWQETTVRAILGPCAKLRPVSFTIPRGDRVALSAKLAAFHEGARA
ncbi:hypothetical protein [Paracoccus versutus]|uniref:hypothetical protein n=1 Tax=Paracoccus versutus TaxID=34007 RepID=UPI0012EE2A78|nr:hypothetical protein [Paracoccus versutus]